uniref:NADH:flavin oxidoreductase/NADH oxidase N-terminal domain-containing protein n=1 Tax=Phytophthora ramorum TaxID=164328 RepID=H3G5L0_PHYRM
HSQEQMQAWKKVTNAVHAKSSNIFLQLWHTGRISHPLNQPNGQPPVSSSSTMGTTTGRLIPTPQGRVPHVTPRALETEEVAGIVADFKTATANTIAAGFDGVELHCANGYLLEQFLRE